MWFYLLATLKDLRQEEKKISLNPLFHLEEDFLLEINKNLQDFLLKNPSYTCKGKTSLKCLEQLKGPEARKKRNLFLYEIFLIAQKYSPEPSCFFKEKKYVQMMQEVRFLEGTRGAFLENILMKHEDILKKAYNAFDYMKMHCKGKETTDLK